MMGKAPCWRPGWLCVLALLIVQAAAVAAAHSPRGIAGSFELYFARTVGANPEPSLEARTQGSFAAQDGNLWAEAAYPLPGGGEERAALLVRPGGETFIIYPETRNYQRVVVGENGTNLLALIPDIVSRYFDATPQRLRELGVSLTARGRQTVAGERLAAYEAGEAASRATTASGGSVSWELTLYFHLQTQRLRVLQVTAPGREVRLTLTQARREDIPGKRFELPAGYYELEPLVVTEAAGGGAGADG